MLLNYQTEIQSSRLMRLPNKTVVMYERILNVIVVLHLDIRQPHILDNLLVCLAYELNNPLI